MKPALMFWTALLFLFAGVMTFLFASGYLDRRDGQIADEAAHAEPALPSATLTGELLVTFELQDQAGLEFDSSSLDGKIWVGSVFFSSCPSTCRVQNMRVAELQQLFGDQGVEFVSVTCDPERDTVATLGEYARMFGAKPDRWHFLTGDFGLIRRIGGEKFGIVVEKETHSDRLVLFDRQGQNVGSYRSTQADQFEILKSEIQRLLAADDASPNQASVDQAEAEQSGAESAQEDTPPPADSAAPADKPVDAESALGMAP